MTNCLVHNKHAPCLFIPKDVEIEKKSSKEKINVCKKILFFDRSYISSKPFSLIVSSKTYRKVSFILSVKSMIMLGICTVSIANAHFLCWHSHSLAHVGCAQLLHHRFTAAGGVLKSPST